MRNREDPRVKLFNEIGGFNMLVAGSQTVDIAFVETLKMVLPAFAFGAGHFQFAFKQQARAVNIRTTSRQQRTRTGDARSEKYGRSNETPCRWYYPADYQ